MKVRGEGASKKGDGRRGEDGKSESGAARGMERGTPSPLNHQDVHPEGNGGVISEEIWGEIQRFIPSWRSYILHDFRWTYKVIKNRYSTISKRQISCST